MVNAPDQRPVPAATGTLATRPLVHLLVYARNRRLTGRMEFAATDGRGGTIHLWRGRITGARTLPPIAYFGAVAYELGLIDTAMLDSTLLEISKTKRLHGEVLIERRAITAMQRDEILSEQAFRKIHHLFGLPPETTFSYFETKPSAEEPPYAVDAIAPAWRGLRDFAPSESVQEVIAKFATTTLRMSNEGPVAYAGLSPDERAVCEALMWKPMTLAQLRAMGHVPQARVDLLVYLLIITKCAEPTTASAPKMETAEVARSGSHPPSGSQPNGKPAPSRPPSTKGATASWSNTKVAAAVSQSQPPHSATISRPNMPAAASTSTSTSTESWREIRQTPSGGFNAVGASVTRSSIPPTQRTAFTPNPPIGRPPLSRPLTSPSGEVVRSSLSFRVPSAPPGPASGQHGKPGSGPRSAPVFGPADLGAVGIAHRARSVETEDYFVTLCLRDNAPPEAARASFFHLAKMWHPDRLPPDLAPFRAEVEKIFGHMTLAHATLTDPAARRTYLMQREDPSSSAAAAVAAKPRKEVIRDIETALSKREFEVAEQMALRLSAVDTGDVEAQALVAWASTFAGEASEETLRAALPALDRAVKNDAYCDRAFYYRGALNKRLGNNPAAFRDFARAVQVNPKHVDAQREVRIYEMRARKGSGEHALDALIAKKKK